MAFEMTSAPRVSPFMPASAMPALKPMQASSMVKPTANTNMPSWFRAVGQTARGVFGDSEAQVRSAASSGIQPAGPWQPDALKQAAQDPAGAFERYGKMGVDEAFDEMGKVYGEEIPTDLSRQEKGMLLMQLGFGIMAGGPGLAQALGQSGMSMMGTWHDLRRDKERKGEASKRARIDALGTRANIAARSEEGAADRAAREAEFKGRQELSREEMAARMREGELDRASRLSLAQMEVNAPPADIRSMTAMGYDPKNPEHRKQFYAEQALSGGPDRSQPADVEHAEWLAAQRAGVEGRTPTHQDKLEAHAAVLAAGSKPNDFREALIKARAQQGDEPDDAVAFADRVTKVMTEGLPQEQARMAEEEGPGFWGTIAAAAQAVLPGADEAAATGPAPGAIENGYRFKGGDPSKQENWEPIAAGR